MKYFGDIELISGNILNLIVDPLNSLPDFDTEQKGRIIYNLNDNSLYLNNSVEYVPIAIATVDSEQLIDTLGTAWINPDLTFNPTNFNNLNFISGLTANDNLFTVFEKLDQSLLEINEILLNEIQDFNIQDPQAGDIIFYDGINFINVPVNQIPNFNIDINLEDLSDVDITGTPTDNETLFFDSSVNNFVNKKWSFVYTNNTPQSNHVVVHNLGKRYAEVTVINTSTNIRINPLSVTYDTDNQLTVNIPVSTTVVILVTIIPV